MNNRTLYLAAVALSGLALAFVVVNMVLINSNRSLQEQITTRGQQIAASNTFAQVYQNLAQSLANVAVQQKDQQIRSLLKDQGLQFSDEQPAPAAATTETKEKK
jgi:uncharacterized protein YpiB (UPF0302 family)